MNVLIHMSEHIWVSKYVYSHVGLSILVWVNEWEHMCEYVSVPSILSQSLIKNISMNKYVCMYETDVSPFVDKSVGVSIFVC